MKMYSLMLFVICLNISAFIIHESGALPTSRTFADSPSTIMSEFDWEDVLIGLGVSAGAGTVMAFFFGFGAALLGGMICWAICSFFPVIQWFFIGAPLMLDALLPSELWFISVSIQAVFAVIFFMFIIELTSQRQIT